MYPTLKPNYVLRSWRDLGKFSAYDVARDHLIDVDEPEYELLALCDGTRTVDEIEGCVDPPELARPHLDFFADRGIMGFGDLPGWPDPASQPHDSPVFLRNACWLITGSCNLTCNHCYMRAPENYWGKPLAWKSLVSMLDEFTRCNVLSVVLTGGEPTSRPDFLRLLGTMRERKIRVRGINTNGTYLLPRNILPELKTLGYPVDIAFSIDGIGFHGEFRGLADFPSLLESVREAVRFRMRPTVNTSVTRDNIEDILKLYDLVKDLGVSGWKLNFPNRIGRWRDRNPRSSVGPGDTLPVLEDSSVIPVAQEFELYQAIFDRWLAEGKPFELSLGNVFRTGKCSGGDRSNEVADVYAKSSYVCNYYRDDVVVMPDGRLLGCNGLMEIPGFDHAGNILEDGLARAWAGPAMRRFKDLTVGDILAMPGNEACRTCPMLEDCGTGCRITAYAETGNVYARDPRMCEMMLHHYNYFRSHDNVTSRAELPASPPS